MDITRLNTKRVAMELVNNVIKSFLSLGYAVATRNQDKVVCEFLQGKDAFVSLPTGDSKSLCFTTLPGVFGYLKISQSLLENFRQSSAAGILTKVSKNSPPLSLLNNMRLPSDFRQWLQKRHATGNAKPLQDSDGMLQILNVYM